MTKTPLYRTVLALAVAAVLAAALPFSLMYTSAVSHRALVTYKSGGRAVVLTRTSGGQTTQVVSTGSVAHKAIPVSTRSS